VLGGSTFVVDGTVQGNSGFGTFHGQGTQTGPTTFTITTTVVYRHGTFTQVRDLSFTSTGTVTLHRGKR
jgi:hypothetical protein